MIFVQTIWNMWLTPKKNLVKIYEFGGRQWLYTYLRAAWFADYYVQRFYTYVVFDQIASLDSSLSIFFFYVLLFCILLIPQTDTK
jgi:hypothetical protein